MAGRVRRGGAKFPGFNAPGPDHRRQQITTAAPRFAKHQTKTDGDLPVIRLVPRSVPDAPHE